ncbi:MAG: hypothetical protein ABGX16_13560 [Pirellulales bacterium]
MATGSDNNIYGDWQSLQPSASVVDEVFTGYEMRRIISSVKESTKPKGPIGANSNNAADTSQKKIQLSQTINPGESGHSTATETEDRNHTNHEVTEEKINQATKSHNDSPVDLVISTRELDGTSNLKLDFTTRVLEGLSSLRIRKQRRSLRMLWAGFTLLLWIVALVILTFVGHLLHLY